MSPPSIRAHISQSLDIIPQLPPQVILQRHRAQFRRHVVDLPVAEGANLGGRVDVELGHELGAGVWADAVEGLERAGDQLGLVEVDAEDEDLGIVSI